MQKYNIDIKKFLKISVHDNTHEFLTQILISWNVSTMRLTILHSGTIRKKRDIQSKNKYFCNSITEELKVWFYYSYSFLSIIYHKIFFLCSSPEFS